MTVNTKWSIRFNKVAQKSFLEADTFPWLLNLCHQLYFDKDGAIPLRVRLNSYTS